MSKGAKVEIEEMRKAAKELEEIANIFRDAATDLDFDPYVEPAVYGGFSEMPRLFRVYEKVRKRSQDVLEDGRWAFFELAETLRHVASAYERDEAEGRHNVESVYED